jgi:hypothetical protein
MLKWLFRQSPPAPPEHQEDVRRRLQAAQRLVRQQKETRDSPGSPSQEPHGSSAREILPSDGPDATNLCRLPSPLTGQSTLAAALESILQGHRVSSDIFTQLYRGGFVFKDPHGRWTITEMGKELIERNKLFTPERCLVAGVECAGGWNRQVR